MKSDFDPEAAAEANLTPAEKLVKDGDRKLTHTTGYLFTHPETLIVEALELYGQALTLDPENKIIQERIEKTKKILKMVRNPENPENPENPQDNTNENKGQVHIGSPNKSQ